MDEQREKKRESKRQRGRAWVKVCVREKWEKQSGGEKGKAHFNRGMRREKGKEGKEVWMV